MVDLLTVIILLRPSGALLPRGFAFLLQNIVSQEICDIMIL